AGQAVAPRTARRRDRAHARVRARPFATARASDRAVPHRDVGAAAVAPRSEAGDGAVARDLRMATHRQARHGSRGSIRGRERGGIERELAEARELLKRSQDLLGKPGFLEKAPKDVVDRERAKLKERESRLQVLEDELKKLRS